MKLKSFHGKTMADAMRQVRATLGDDAIIVSSREKGGRVHVTAALDTAPENEPSPFEIVDRAPAVRKNRLVLGDGEMLAEITGTLLRHRVPADLTDKIVSHAAASGAPSVRAGLEHALARTFRYAPLPQKKSASPIVLVGAPGAGKTLCAAKMAARGVMKGLDIAVISTDTVRAGGVEQLQAFLDLMEIGLLVANDARAVKSALKSCEDADQIIIDTGGLNPFDPAEMKELARILKTDDTLPVLVMAAGGDAEECAEMALTFGVLGVRHILPTRLDFARRLGGILYAADRAKMTFTEASHTPAVANGLLPLSAQVLANLLIPGKKD